ncbi:hypothetical protein QZH41_008492 [Actinostola sp. cb2023]|nr:hypothetical protein QZH41_008492 [Actinostola sp. cb2023]
MALTNTKIPPRFAISDWHTSNVVMRTNAERQRESSHQIRQEGRWLRNETDNHTRWTQHDSNTKLEKRIDDINDWRKSLEKCLAETDHEIAKLQVEKDRTERALEAKKVPLDIALQCLMLRENRLNIDLVRDEVEGQLNKEVEVIEGTKALLQQKVDEAAEQLCLLQEARHQLHLDLTDKYTTLQIDGDCHTMNNMSSNIGFHVNPTRTIKGSVTPETWDSFSNYNKLRAEAEMKASQHLREAIFSTLQQTANDLEAQRKASEYAFRKRTHESQQAKSELEWQQKNTDKEIATLEGDIRELKDAIDAKNAPMMVAQTRLENRTYRPNIELCRDQPQYQLCHEVAQISGSIRALTEKLRESENSLQALRSTLNRINEDLAIKSNSIALENRCVNVREKMREIPHSMTDDHPFGPPIGNKQYSTMMNSLGQYTTTTKDPTQPDLVLPPATGGHFSSVTKQYTLPTGYTGSLRAIPEMERKQPIPIAE